MGFFNALLHKSTLLGLTYFVQINTMIIIIRSRNRL